jgi:hypothetical protein
LVRLLHGVSSFQIVLVGSYKINPLCSRSTIRDDLDPSLPEKDREFPLFSKGKEKGMFEQGVALLNKNIQQLVDACIQNGTTCVSICCRIPHVHAHASTGHTIGTHASAVHTLGAHASTAHKDISARQHVSTAN